MESPVFFLFLANFWMICFKLRWKRGYCWIITSEIGNMLQWGPLCKLNHLSTLVHDTILSFKPASVLTLAHPLWLEQAELSLLTLRAQRANINKSNKSVAREYERAPFRHVRTHCEMWPCRLFCSAQALDNIFYLSRTGSTKGGGGTVGIHVRHIHGEALLGDEEHR